MRATLLRHILSALAAALALSVLVFVLIRIIPGDAVTLWIGQEGSMPPAVQETLRRMFGLTDPIYQQYFSWLSNVLRGDLGYSFRSRLPVLPALLQALPYTLELAFGATILSTLIAVPLGVISATKRNSATDLLARLLALIGLSLPTFWIGVLLILLSSAAFHWLPSLTYSGLLQDPMTNLQQMFMPGITLALPLMGVVMRMTRSSVLEVLEQDYVRTARAKGIARKRVLLRHALPNAAIPIVTVLGARVRQALDTAIDRQLILDNALGGAGALTGPIPYGWADYGIAPDQLPFKLDLAAAKSLMSAAGYGNGFQVDCVTLPEGHPANFYPTIATAADGWKQLGVEVNIQPMELAAWLDKNNKNDFDLIVSNRGFRGDPIDILMPAFHSGGVDNQGYTNPQVDTWLEQASKEPDRIKRRDLYLQVQKQVMADAVWSFLWVPVETDAMQRYVQGYDHVAFDGFRDLMAATWIDKG